MQLQSEQLLRDSEVKQSVAFGQRIVDPNESPGSEQSRVLLGEDTEEINPHEMAQGSVGKTDVTSKPSKAIEEDDRPRDKSRRAAQDDEPSTTPGNERSPKEAISAEGDEQRSTKRMSSVLDETTILPVPDLADGQGNNDAAHKPIQMHVEPAPITQPAEAQEPSDRASEPVRSGEADSSITGIASPTFPTAPNDEPDSLHPSGAPNFSSTGTSTPVDPTFIKAFPAVPDEERPRVEVHVSSSPVNTPQKGLPSSTQAPGTPLADLPGHSKSLTQPPANEQQTPSGTGRETVQLEVDTTPNSLLGSSRRLSSRKSPKSPLLDDEDPGDFEPGEGWAVVTK